jgi:hypothetical protein
MKPYPSETPAPLEAYYSQEDWVIIKGKQLTDPAYDTEYFFVWAGETLLEPSFIEAALKLNLEQQSAKQDAVVGCSIMFHPIPTPGFVVRTRATWDFESPSEAGNALSKLLWEVNRLNRA